VTDRVLVVEHEAVTRELLRRHLEREGFAVCLAHEAEQGMRELLAVRPDIVILDMLLPGVHSLEMLRQLRHEPSSRDLPVLVVSRRDTEMDKLLCFEHGADDFVVQPFSPRELTARIRVLIRRSRPTSQEPVIEVGSLRVNPLAREAAFQGRPITLAPREFDLLLFFARHPGRVWSRGELLRNVWGSSFEGDIRTVDVHVRRLRFKLGSDRATIETVTGMGYKLIAFETPTRQVRGG